jgi:hypothetical protein
MEIWKIVVPAVTAILLWLLAKWNDDRKRNLDRRAVPYDQRIQVAKKYVDTLQIEILSFERFYDILIDGPKAFHEKFEDFMREFPNLSSLIQEFTLNVSIIRRVNDSELSRLDEELNSLVSPIMENFLDVWDRLISEENVDLKSIDLEKLIFPDEVDNIITKMKIRLDKLAEKVP